MPNSRQLSRTASLSEQLAGFKDLTTLLISAAQQESRRLEFVRSRLIEVAEVVPLGTSVLAAATQYHRIHGLSAQDAIVYSSVLTHLSQIHAAEACFLNRNAKDFDDQNIVEELAGHNCQLFVRFDAGYSFIRDALG